MASGAVAEQCMEEAWAWHLAGAHGMWSLVPSFISKRLKNHPRFGTVGAIGKVNSGWGVWAASADNPKLWQCCLGRLHMQTPQLSFPSGYIQPSLSLEEGGSQEPQGSLRVIL